VEKEKTACEYKGFAMWKTLWIMWKTIRNPLKIKDLRKPKRGEIYAKKIPKSEKMHIWGKPAQPIVPRVICPKKAKKGNQNPKLYTTHTGYTE